MGTDDKVVFVSTAPGPWKLWSECESEWMKWKARVAVFETEIGSKAVARRKPFSGAYEIVGVREIGPDTTGWVKLKSNDHFTPNKRSAAGRRVAEFLKNEMTSIGTMERFAAEFKVPETIFVGLRMVMPGLFGYDGRVWVIFSADPGEQWDGGEHFTRSKLSEFYAAKESFAAAAATDGKPS